MTQIPGRHAIEISDGISPYRSMHADAHPSELRLGPSPSNLNSSRSLDAMATDEQLKAFIARHRVLLEKEREAEIERTSLLLSNGPPKLLEQKGLCLAGLGVASVGIGLGGKTCV